MRSCGVGSEGDEEKWGWDLKGDEECWSGI